MPDPEIVKQLKTAAIDAVNRGFAILTLTPHDKDPWGGDYASKTGTKNYSPHAVNSSTRNLDIALKAWEDGHEANYGVGGGPSNITIIDVDDGIANYNALKEWMSAVGLPETFTVQSGRDTSFGAHLYYSGAVATTPYTIQGVTGELRGIGAYVVGPGCIHPDSGKKYEIINDISIVPLPTTMVELAANKKKSMSDFKPGKGALIPEGNRWSHLQAKAGVFKNIGLDEEGIYNALKNFAENNCENGGNYPDDKIRNLAEWAASDSCEGVEPTGILTFGSPDPEADTGTPDISLETIEGDYVGDLVGAITAGTMIPPSFARADIKTIMGSILDGKIAFPGEETLHMRHWTGLVSSRPGAGKSICWDRCMLLLNGLAAKHELLFPPSGYMSSGEHAIKILAENDNKSQIIYFDEMKSLFEKGNHGGSTLFPKLIELYEQKSSAVGSLTHSIIGFKNVSLSMVGNFTRSGFDRAVSGKGAGGDGFLSRMVLDYSEGINYQGDWEPMDTVKTNIAINHITESIAWIANFIAIENKGLPFIPKETEDGHHTRLQFQKWLAGEKTRIQNEHPESSYVARLESHFKRDLLIRVAFNPERQITKTLVEKSWAWAKHQLMLCEELWPVDNGGPVEKFEKRIIGAITKKGPLTLSGVQKFSNADKSEGGFDAWNRAWRNLQMAKKIIMLAVKSDRGKEKYGFDDAAWNKSKQKWIFGDQNA